MNPFTKIIKNIIYMITAVLAGISLFLMLTGYNMSNSLLSPNFHKQLFVKYNIYMHTYDVITNSLTGFINNLKTESPQNYEHNKDVFSILEKFVTTDMVNENLDSLRDGMFEYFRDERKFLPDINFIPQPELVKASTTPSNGSSFPSQALANISKVNLGAILLSVNRNDIIDYLSIIKFLYYAITVLPGLLQLLFLLTCLIGLIIFEKFAEAARWISIMALTCGIFGFLSGLSLLVYATFIMPGNIFPIAMSLPLPTEAIISYIKNCLTHLSVFHLISGILFMSLTAGASMLPKLFPVLLTLDQAYYGSHSSTVDALVQPNGKKSGNIDKGHIIYSIVKYSLYIFLFMILTSSINNKYIDLKKDFKNNDFYTVIAKMKGTNTVTQVIAAKDDAIYDVEVKLVDEKTNKPVPGATITVFGRSNVNKKEFNETKTIDEKGIVKFSLDKGSFRLSFNQTTFPAQYKMPSSIFFDLKGAGTRIITVNLENAINPDKQKWGIVEIEVLDKENKPVSNLELALQGEANAPGNPNNIYSVTNAEGIAVFKINEGSYKIGFTEAKLPKKYQLPSVLEVNSVFNNVGRYTVRLVDLPAAKTPVPANQRATTKR